MSAIIEADFKILEKPNDPDLAALYAYWQKKRGKRLMPSRGDIDPADIAPVLPHVFLIESVPPPHYYRYRLHGSALAEFHGRDFTGLAIHETISQRDADQVIRVFDGMAAARAPLFATGPVFWTREGELKGFESCNLPLSADGSAMNMVFGAIKFGLFKPRILSLPDPNLT